MVRAMPGNLVDRAGEANDDNIMGEGGGGMGGGGRNGTGTLCLVFESLI